MLAFIGTPLTVVNFVFAAFSTARFTNVRTEGAELMNKLRAATHKGGSRKARFSTVSIETDALCHLGNVAFTEASVGTVLTLLCASQTGINTGLVFLVGHVNLPVRNGGYKRKCA
jgi:uncharacterized MnhB-related membrane protein